MNFTKVIIVFLILISFFCIPVNAQVINGDFETGNLTGWDLEPAGSIYPSINTYTASWGGDYSVRLHSNHAYRTASIIQNISWADYRYLNFSAARSGVTGTNSYIRVSAYANGGWITLWSSSSFPISWHNRSCNVSEYSGLGKIKFSGRNWFSDEYAYFDNIELTGYAERIEDSFIQFDDTPYNEYDNAIVNFSVKQIMTDYPDKLIYLEIATPKITEPYYNYAAYELTEFTGYRGLAIEGKHPIYDAYHNCSAYIRAYDSDMSNYETLLEIEQSVLWDNHTLINYTGYDYPTNKSYITGQNIGLLVDIMDYIETDFLGYPDELFTVWIKGFSNSNQGNTEQSFDLDAMYWNADRYYIKHIECAPFSIIDSDFNATVECYVSVYRNGNTTKLTPTIYTNMYASSYIPEGETGYIPPDIPEEPEEPDAGENETLPINPDIPDVPTVTNDSINTSWVYYYYEGVNNSFDTLCEPIYNFTAYTLTPIYLLNDSITDYNYIMNESFTETTQKINILSGSFNIIYSAFHPKIVNVMTYYLIWLVLLIILKKR